MIRTLWNVFALLLLIHLLATAGFVLWLRGSGRLDQARLSQVVALFKTTIADEQAAQEAARQEELEQQQQRGELARLEEVADGPTTVGDRLRNRQEDDEVALQKLEMTERAMAILRKNIENAGSDLARQQAAAEQERRAFEQRMAARLEVLADENFQQAVSVYESLKPDQAKAMLLELIEQGEEDQVIEYLAAMQLRKSAKVLSQFEAGAEAKVASRLIEGLRLRGLEPTAAPTQVAGGPR